VLFRLLDLGAIGLVTTHDLALAEMSRARAGRSATCTSRTTSRTVRCASTTRCVRAWLQKSNALALMRAAGSNV